MAGFTGVLVGRRYKPGQKYIQLVFKTTEGLKLSLSRNLQMVRSLNMGKTYHIEGPLYQMGQKVFIHEPTATFIPPKEKSFVSRHKLIFSTIVVVSIVGAAGFLLTARGGSAKHNETPSHSIGSQPNQSPDNSNVNEASSAPATSDESTNSTPSPASSPSKTTKKSTSATSTTQTPSIPSPDPVPPATIIDPPATPPIEQTPPPTDTGGGTQSQDIPTETGGGTDTGTTP
jgi:hypothetical protein